jgi:hypothetical protein
MRALGCRAASGPRLEKFASWLRRGLQRRRHQDACADRDQGPPSTGLQTCPQLTPKSIGVIGPLGPMGRGRPPDESYGSYARGHRQRRRPASRNTTSEPGLPPGAVPLLNGRGPYVWAGPIWLTVLPKRCAGTAVDGSCYQTRTSRCRESTIAPISPMGLMAGPFGRCKMPSFFLAWP